MRSAQRPSKYVLTHGPNRPGSEWVSKRFDPKIRSAPKIYFGDRERKDRVDLDVYHFLFYEFCQLLPKFDRSTRDL